MCVQMIYSELLEIGKSCNVTRDAAFQRELTASVARMDQFVTTYSPEHPTQAQINAERADFLKAVRAQGGICQEDGVMSYEQFQQGGAAAIRSNTDDLLSHPNHESCL